MKSQRSVKRDITFSLKALGDLQSWMTENPKIAQKIAEFAEECARTPFDGKGKPEPLKHGIYKTYWSRRLETGHRFIYKVDDSAVYIASCKGHYDDK
ncbi:Txe/YoeB family addiction module toxin [Spirosoma sordidisoli]|uniref:Putative mRNA interferase YoeB n=1 Tax=Spirosoma sordidisoli TaxID=2502893 RepID=A0A4Q2USU6_9BACT|nr:Txe/YoeB family addiction module toxin [Spirosoma sordidisoli]RYC70855.1 Txe/YoeB family addiction module toxin [Spirosoma sordidisoli]